MENQGANLWIGDKKGNVHVHDAASLDEKQTQKSIVEEQCCVNASLHANEHLNCHPLTVGCSALESWRRPTIQFRLSSVSVSPCGLKGIRAINEKRAKELIVASLACQYDAEGVNAACFSVRHEQDAHHFVFESKFCVNMNIRRDLSEY